MYCSNCGKELPSSSAFCSKCGTNQTSSPTPSYPPPPVAQSAPIYAAKQSNKTWTLALFIVLSAAVLCIGGFILFDRLTSNHSDGIPSDTVTAAAVNTGSGAASETMNAISDKSIIGMWSTEGPSGELVDPATGLTSGSIFNGEWYIFRDDGTFRYVIVSSGQVLSGGVVWEGIFSVCNGEIRLTNIKESWYPNPAATGQKKSYENKKTDDVTLQYQYGDDKNMLIIDDSDYFTRVEE